MKKAIAALLQRSTSAKSKKKIREMWRPILGRFIGNEAEIIAFLKRENTPDCDIINAIRPTKELTWYVSAMLWAKSADGDEELNDAAVSKIRQCFPFDLSQFKLLKRLAESCEDEHEAYQVADLLLAIKLPSKARILVEHLRKSIDNEGLGSETLIAYIAAVEAMTL